jgi:hypothetical protein
MHDVGNVAGEGKYGFCRKKRMQMQWQVSNAKNIMNVKKIMNHVGTGLGDAINLVISAPPACGVDVLNPNFRMTASNSAFCNGFESEAAKTLFVSVGSAAPLYALMAMMGVLVFLLLVFLMYLAALSPST